MFRLLPRLTVIAILAVAWLGASNHCALAALASAGDHACCHAPAEAPSPNAKMECCDSLGAPVPPSVSAPDAASGSSVLPPDAIGAAVPENVPVCFPAGRVPGAPPGGAFVELVLQKILPAQGPPASV